MRQREPDRLNANLSGAAGAYFVAAELSRRGYIATLTVRNARGIDLLVTNGSATRAASIQVKTNQGTARSWVLDRKAEDVVADRLFYVFVNLNGRASPSFHVVASAIVAEYCRRTHQEWLAGVRRDGLPRRDNPVREFHDRECAYLDAWQRLGLDEVVDSLGNLHNSPKHPRKAEETGRNRVRIQGVDATRTEDLPG